MDNQKVSWIVRFSVDKSWVADGFDIDDERALDILSHALRYANVGTELDAKVLRKPAKALVERLQGYRE